MGRAALECRGYVIPVSLFSEFHLLIDYVAWEVSQTFAANWAWLLDEEIIRSSNFWRGERGDGPLILPDFGGASLNNMNESILEEVY